MEECPPGGDCASGEGDPSKSDNPPASWTPNPAGEQTQGESVSRGDDASQAASHSPQSKRKKDSSATSASQVLKKHEDEFFDVVNPKHNLLWLKRKEVISEGLISKIETANTRDAKEILFEHLHRNADVAALREYCKMAIAANGFPRMQKLGKKMQNELTLEGMAMAVNPSPDVSSLSLESYKMDIVSCDVNVFESQKHPAEAIWSLYFNAYNHLIRILSTHCSAIKSVAVRAVRMKQVVATEDEVAQSRDLNALFECLEVDKKWNDLHFLDVAIMSLPVEASKEKGAAQLVLTQYKSYLAHYMKAVSIKEGKSVRSFLQRKRGREEKMVVTEITIDKEIDEYTCLDLLDLWKLFLIETLEIPDDRIEYRLARAGNSTMLVFMITQTYAEGIKKKLSKPATVWVMKELGILRVYVAGVVSVDLREVLPNALIASIREGLKSGVDFVSLTKVRPPLMCSLLDRVPEPKETQPGSIQTHSAGPAELLVQEPAEDCAEGMGSNPLERFKSLVLRAIENKERKIFGIALLRGSEVVTTPLSRRKRERERKSSPLTYKISINQSIKMSSGQWVVKFNPLGPQDPWHDVKKEYSILKGLHQALPVPKPVYASDSRDEGMVGTAFIVMEFVKGDTYGYASKVPASIRSSICTAAVKAMAKVHRYFWVADGQKKQDGLSRDFWSKQVSTWYSNYSSGWNEESTSQLFRMMQDNDKPNGRNTVIHGNANISNFVFERSHSGQYNVKAILDWKYDTNGDPMVDVGYFLMMFLQPVDYGYTALEIEDLLMGPPGNGTPSEHQLLDAYFAEARRLIDAPDESRNPNPSFIRAYGQSVSASDRMQMLNYAKAVSCLRLITVVKAAWSNSWRGHESGKHAGVRNHPQEIIGMLTDAGRSFYRNG